MEMVVLAKHEDREKQPDTEVNNQPTSTTEINYYFTKIQTHDAQSKCFDDEIYCDGIFTGYLLPHWHDIVFYSMYSV